MSLFPSMFHTSNSQPPLSPSILFYLSLHLFSKLWRKSFLFENCQINVESNQGLLNYVNLWPSDIISGLLFSCSRALRQGVVCKWVYLAPKQTGFWWPSDDLCSELLPQILLVPARPNSGITLCSCVVLLYVWVLPLCFLLGLDFLVLTSFTHDSSAPSRDWNSILV